MVNYNSQQFKIFFSRKVLIIDTNVIYAYFIPSDKNHSDVKCFLDEYWDGDIIVPAFVVIEAWGLIVSGKNKLIDIGIRILIWLQQKTNIIVMPHPTQDFTEAKDISQKHRIDCVDACLICLVIELSEKCGFDKYIPIFTTDMTDFNKLKRDFKKLSLYDLRTLDIVS